MLDGVTSLSTADVITVIGLIAVALAAIWPAKKVISFLNKS